MMRVKKCTMCDCTFQTRRPHTQTCSPRCRKRRQRVLEGTALGTWRMGVRGKGHYGIQWR